jgi:hypothetical protein
MIIKLIMIIMLLILAKIDMVISLGIDFYIGRLLYTRLFCT